MENVYTQRSPIINLFGKAYHLSPELERISRVEQILSLSALELAKRLSNGVITMHELFVVVETCLVSDSEEIDLKSAFNHVGMTRITEAVTSLFVILFTGYESTENEDYSELRQMLDTADVT